MLNYRPCQGVFPSALPDVLLSFLLNGCSFRKKKVTNTNTPLTWLNTRIPNIADDTVKFSHTWTTNRTLKIQIETGYTFLRAIKSFKSEPKRISSKPLCHLFSLFRLHLCKHVLMFLEYSSIR